MLTNIQLQSSSDRSGCGPSRRGNHAPLFYTLMFWRNPEVQAYKRCRLLLLWAQAFYDRPFVLSKNGSRRIKNAL